MSRYPYCPTGVEVFKECDGYYRAVVTDGAGTRRNVARPNCQTKKQAINDAREELDLPVADEDWS